ncbi:MAG: hypothetical protein NTZ74_09390 [Chloroflexi bacterium]|nr:hypothetical protein [Chloroflexota bacterium]
MAASIIVRKCQQCAGRLEYIKEKKIYKCLYCGAVSEREEQYDGLFTIKNVVRQVLLDVAYRRLESAEKNLVECEKIDSRYIGTIIAKIAYQMIVAVTPGAYPQAELRNLFLQLQRNYEALQAIGKSISEDEEGLYEYFDSADVFATLLLVYDSLNDTKRRDYVAEMVNAAEVYAKEPNKNLISYALKNAKFDLIDKLLSNSENVEPSFALKELLLKYPDNDNKVKNIERLLKSQVFKQEDKLIFESYLMDSADSLSTKGKMIVFAYATSIKVSLEKIIIHLLTKSDDETVDSVLRQVCSSRLKDEDVYRILDFAISAKTISVVMIVLSVLKDTNQYVLMTSKHIISFLSRTDLNTSDKTTILNKLFEFNLDAKSKDAAMSSYLCFNEDAQETRLAVFQVLLRMIKIIQTNTIENYVLKVNTDGEIKPTIVEQIFSLDLNMSFFHDLLVKYMNSSVDTKEVKDKIVPIFVGKGLKIDPKAFIDYICNSTVQVPDKIDFVKKMLINGTLLRGDTVNAYLETITPEQYSSELFSLIVSSASNISEKALSNYLLVCKDRKSQKVKNLTVLSKQCQKKVTEVHCDAVFAGQKISGNILPIYLLVTPDSFEVAKEIADYLIVCKAKVISDIQIDGAGSIKFKKFVMANLTNLNPATEQLCSAYKLS